MAIKNEIIRGAERTSETLTVFSTFSSGGANRTQNATTIVDVSALDADDRFPVQALRICSIAGTVHIQDQVNTAAYKVYLLDSNNEPMFFIGDDFGGKVKFYDGLPPDTTWFSANANGDLKIACGQIITRASGALSGTLGVDDGYSLTIECKKIYAES